MGQYVAMLSITVNYKTLKEVKYVNCKLVRFANGVSHSILSDKAYIVNVTFPGQSQPTNYHISSTEYFVTNFSLNTAHKENLSVITMITSILSLIIIKTIFV